MFTDILHLHTTDFRMLSPLMFLLLLSITEISGPCWLVCPQVWDQDSRVHGLQNCVTGAACLSMPAYQPPLSFFFEHLNNLFLFILCVFILSAYMCTTCMPGTSRGQKTVSVPLELDVHIAMGYHVDVGATSTLQHWDSSPAFPQPYVLSWNDSERSHAPCTLS